MELKPTTNVCDAIRVIKANFSKWLHENWPELNGLGWQTGYAAFTVSESARAKVVKYINDQQEHHKKMSFDEELIALLQRHGVKYDSQALSD